MSHLADHCSEDWHIERQRVEANPSAATSEELDHYNVWTDDLKTVIEVLSEMQADRWEWCRNSRCKYIQLRIDMRTGLCRLCDSNGERITGRELRYQFDEEDGE